MNKKRQTSYLLFLLLIITITGGLSFGHVQALSQAAGIAPKAGSSAVSNQAGTNGLSSFLPPGLAQSIINQVRNTNATSFALHNALNATTSALHKTPSANATNAAAGMNKTAGANATNAAAGMNKTAGANATNAAAGMNKTAGANATNAAAAKINSTLNLVRNTNATKFAANNIINATKNATRSPP